VQFQKYSYSPHRKVWNFLGGVAGEGVASVRSKHLKKCMKLNWNFQRGGEGVLDNIPSSSVGEVWVFSGTTQSIKSGFQRFHKVYVKFRTSLLQSVIK